MPDGVYTFTAVDVFNRTTIGMLKHFAFELSVSSALSHAVYDEYAGKFISRVALEAWSNSGYGVREIEVYPVRHDLASDEVVYLPKLQAPSLTARPIASSTPPTWLRVTTRRSSMMIEAMSSRRTSPYLPPWKADCSLIF